MEDSVRSESGGRDDLKQQCGNKEGSASSSEADRVAELVRAAWGGRLDTVRSLVEQDADVNAKDDKSWTPLLRAASGGHLDIVTYLVEQGADIDAKDGMIWTALTRAAVEGRLNTVRCLVELGADVNADDGFGRPALLHAASFGRLDILQYFFKRGAKVNAKYHYKRTALQFAASGGHLDTVRYLVEHGARVNTKDELGFTALLNAASNGHVDTIRYLVKQGANIKTKNGIGETALQRAADKGHLDAVRCLVELGADVNVKDKQKSAIAVAEKRGHKDVERFLLQHISSAPSVQSKQPSVPSTTPDTLPEWLISPFEVTATKFVEGGSIGGDFLATWLDAQVVLKLFVPDANNATFDQEVRVWHQLRHPNAIKLYGACNVGYHFFVCEYASHGSVVEYLSKCEPDARTPWKYLHHAALGLAYLHERGIVHGSLRESSILLGSDGLAKLADFGLNGASRRGTAVGLRWWQSPEQLNGANASFASDVYALGMCAIEAVTRKLPWGGQAVEVVCLAPRSLGRSSSCAA